MATHCSVPWSKQRGPKYPGGNKVSYHRFPRDDTLYKTWIIAIKRDEGKYFKVAKCTRVCSSFGNDRFKYSNEDFLDYTGIPSYQHFLALMTYINPGKNGSNVLRNAGIKDSGGRRRKLTAENELFLVLLRLRLGLFEHDLAHRFGTQSTASRICVSWINFMYIRLCKLPLWVSRAVLDGTMTAAFSTYPTTRVILDATEIKCEVPSSLSLQSSSYFTYKASNTFKRLIVVSPNGLVTFVSELYTGSISDREAVLKSGFLNLKFDKNDSVMADKGFLIQDLLTSKNVKLNIPPFLHRNALSEQEEAPPPWRIIAFAAGFRPVAREFLLSSLPRSLVEVLPPAPFKLPTC
ncbi:uncharacterized protein LOC144122917 [Amblyomma americanum]